MKIHEYQAAQLFQSYGVPVPEGRAAFTVEEAEEAARQLACGPFVVKAQVHSGGRGKAGGGEDCSGNCRNDGDCFFHDSFIMNMLSVQCQ